MTIKRVGRGALGLVLIACQWGLAWYGLRGLAWCWNLYRFALWFFFVMSLFLIKADPEKLREEGRAVPTWFCLVSDVALACLIAAQGHFFYAALTLLQGLIEAAVFMKAAEEAKKFVNQRAGEIVPKEVHWL